MPNPEAWRHPRMYCCRKCGKQWAAPPLRQPEYGCPDPEYHRPGEGPVTYGVPTVWRAHPRR